MPPKIIFDKDNPAPALVSYILQSPHNRGRPSVLSIGREQFWTDLHAMREGFNSRYNWLELQALALTKIQAGWVPEHLQVQCFDQNSTDGEEGWNRCAEFAEGLLKELRSKVSLVAVMAASTDYWVDEGLRRACFALNIPFTALYREVCPNEKFWDDFYRTHDFKANAAGMAVAGRLTWEVMTKWGVLPRDKLVVTGLPRFDWWLTPPPQDGRPSVVFLTFMGADYFAAQTFREALQEFAAAAMRHRDKDVDFIIKCKHQQDLQAVQEIMRELFPDQQIHGILYSTETNLGHALRNARAVIGFNSLSLVEALLSRAAIYDVCWGKAQNHRYIFSPDNPQHASSINFICSPAAFAAALDRMAEGKPEPGGHQDDRLEIVQRFVEFRPGESATTRVDQFMDEMVRRGAR